MKYFYYLAIIMVAIMAVFCKMYLLTCGLVWALLGIATMVTIVLIHFVRNF